MVNQHDAGRREGDFVLYTPTEVENELPFQLLGAGVHFYQYPIDRPFGFPSYQWIQTIDGAGRLMWDENEEAVADGSGMLLFPNEKHAYRATTEPWHVHWITFSGHHVPSMLHYLGMNSTGVYRASNPEAIASLIAKALSTLRSDYPLRGVDGSGLVYQLLLSLLKYVRNSDSESHDARIMRLKPAFDLIEKRLDRPLSLDDLADSVGVSPQYFCDLFRSFTSRRPVEYINQRRIDRAKELLVGQRSMRVHDIARRVGFESDSYFSTVFRRFEGVTPRRYREINAAQDVPHLSHRS